MSRRPTGERLGLGDRLVAERRRRGLRQIDAAREIGVSRETVALIEVDHIPSAATAAKVRRWLSSSAKLPAAVGRRAAKAAGRGAELRARARERRAAARRIGGERRRVLARLAVRRKARRALRAAGLRRQGEKPRR